MRSGEGLRSKALAATASSLVSAGVLGVAAVVMARTLGPTGRGEFASSYSLVFVLVVLGSMGVGPGGRRLLAIWPAPDGASRAEYSSTVRWLVVGQVPLAAFGAAVLLPLFGAGQSGSQKIAFVACCVTTLSSLLARDALFGLGRGVAASVILAGGCTATFAGVLAVAVAGLSSVAWFLWMYALAAAGETLVASLVAVRAADPVGDIRPGSRARLLAAGWAGLVLLLAQAAATRGDRLVIGATAGSTDLGQYAVAVSVMELLSLGSFALGNVAFQGLASGALPVATMRRARAVTVGATAGVALVLVAVAPWLVRVTFGSRFDAAVPALRVLALAAIPYGSLQIDSQHLIASARTGAAAAVAVAVAAFMLVGDLFVVPRWGIVGAAWVSVAVYGAFAVVTRAVLGDER